MLEESRDIPPGQPGAQDEDTLAPAVAAGPLGATLDINETAQQVLGMAVSGLADGGAVYLLEPLLSGGRPAGSEASDRVVTRCLAFRAPKGSPGIWHDFAADDDVVIFSAGMPQARCLTGGEPVLFTQDSCGASFLAVPLAAREGVTGMLLLCRLPVRPGFAPGDLARAAELAAQTGVYVDNARLFTREQRIAQALQRGLLPHDPPAPPGVDIAHRYRPAGDHLVGGDWYDIVPLPGDRATIMVGDAMGHGPEAATVMVQLRAAAHALADLGLSPGELLGRLNRMAATLTHGTFATCVCATVDPPAGSGVIARAGHLPPVLCMPGQACGEVDLPPGLPLGLGDATYEAVQVSLPAGATLALYTDGLVESRKRAFDEGILALRGQLAACAAAPLQQACDAIVDMLFHDGEDDTTLVLARMP